MQVNAKVTVSVDEIRKIAPTVYVLVIKGIHNIDVELAGIMEMTDTDYADYKEELRAIAQCIRTMYDKGIAVAVNLVTDTLFREAPVIEDEFIVCEGCPCVQCVPDKKLFKEYTGDEFIPPERFCRKSFIELAVAGELKKEAGWGEDWHDINEKDWFDLKILQRGSSLAIPK